MPTVSIVGGESPLGRELRDVLQERKIAATVQMLGATEEAASVFTEHEGEATVLTPLDAPRLSASDVVFCAGDRASSRKAYELAKPRGAAALVDLTYALEELPEVRVRSPLNETEAPPSKGGIYLVAHPAASALALLLSRLHRAHPLRHSVVHVFEPASERGQAGVAELQQQVSSLLTFRKLDKRVFDAQTGFNMLPRYGEDAPESLEDIEARLGRHLATLLAGAVPMPSLRLIQAPVFHGHSLSLWVEFEVRPSVTAVEEALASAHIEVRGSDVEAPTNVGVAGQSGVIAGVVQSDDSHPRGMWIWAVADNYRILADNAVEIASNVLSGSQHP